MPSLGWPLVSLLACLPLRGQDTPAADASARGRTMAALATFDSPARLRVETTLWILDRFQPPGAHEEPGEAERFFALGWAERRLALDADGLTPLLREAERRRTRGLPEGFSFDVYSSDEVSWEERVGEGAAGMLRKQRMKRFSLVYEGHPNGSRQLHVVGVREVGLLHDLPHLAAPIVPTHEGLFALELYQWTRLATLPNAILWRIRKEESSPYFLEVLAHATSGLPLAAALYQNQPGERERPKHLSYYFYADDVGPDGLVTLARVLTGKREERSTNFRLAEVQE